MTMKYNLTYRTNILKNSFVHPKSTFKDDRQHRTGHDRLVDEQSGTPGTDRKLRLQVSRCRPILSRRYQMDRSGGFRHSLVMARPSKALRKQQNQTVDMLFKSYTF